MATKAEKKKAIRQDIIDSAEIYSRDLAGKIFLYVYGEEFFEVFFSVNHFLHLTGVEMGLSAKSFYKNAKKGILINEMVCILKDMQTDTVMYKISVTNLEFTLGLIENMNNQGKKINTLFLPMSLRVGDSSVEKSADGEIVDFILVKDASNAKYSDILVKDESKNIPDCVHHLINEAKLNNL